MAALLRDRNPPKTKPLKPTWVCLQVALTFMKFSLPDQCKKVWNFISNAATGKKLTIAQESLRQNRILEF